MSPKSRGRFTKNRSSKGPASKQAPARRSASGAWPPVAGFGAYEPSAPAAPRRTGLDALDALASLIPDAARMRAESRSWWPESHSQVLDDAASLHSCVEPVELEDAVCDLLGRHWRGLYEERHSGLAPEEWLTELLHAADRRLGDRGVRRLLYGLALIAKPWWAGQARKVLGHGSVGPSDEEPSWLAVPPTMTVSPDLLVLRDAYGLRFGLLSQVTRPTGHQRTYLFDIDLCHGSTEVLTSGYHPDIASATAAWRGLVGTSAVAAEPEPAPDALLAQVLPGGGLFDGLFGGPVSEGQFTELFRGDGVLSAVFEALDRAGRPWREVGGDGPYIVLADSMSEQFKAWAARHHVDLPPSTGPDDDVVTWLARDWVSPGMSETWALACSPHRVAAFTAYLNDDWHEGDRALALALLQPWVRFCLERSGVGGAAAGDVLAWAERAAREPAVVGADLGNYLNRPIDETTVTSPPLRIDTP